LADPVQDLEGPGCAVEEIHDAGRIGTDLPDILAHLLERLFAGFLPAHHGLEFSLVDFAHVVPLDEKSPHRVRALLKYFVAWPTTGLFAAMNPRRHLRLVRNLPTLAQALERYLAEVSARK